jgi:hypothetical protein
MRLGHCGMVCESTARVTCAPVAPPCFDSFIKFSNSLHNAIYSWQPLLHRLMTILLQP